MKNSINNTTNTLNLNGIMDKLLNNSGIHTTNLDNVYEGLESGSGTFKEIYRLYQANKVKLITKNGQVVGLDIEGGRTHTEDMLAGMRFEYLYRGTPVQKYIETILELQLQGITLKANQIKETADVVTLKLDDNKAIKISKRSGVVTKVTEAPRPKTPKAPKASTYEDAVKLWSECLDELTEAVEAALAIGEELGQVQGKKAPKKKTQGKKAPTPSDEGDIEALFNPGYEDYE